MREEWVLFRRGSCPQTRKHGVGVLAAGTPNPCGTSGQGRCRGWTGVAVCATRRHWAHRAFLQTTPAGGEHASHLVSSGSKGGA